MEDNNRDPFYEYVFSKIESGENIDRVIDLVLEKVGVDFQLSMVVVKELTDDEYCIRCTYEWSKDGKRDLVDVEHRYYNTAEYDAWVSRLTGNGFSTYNIEDGCCPVRVSRKDIIISLIQIPLISEGKLIGCVDLVDSRKHRDWTEEERAAFDQMASMLSSYLLHIRDMQLNSIAVKEYSEYDNVTGLPKYEPFLTRVDEIRSHMTDSMIVFVYLDLSNLKYLNEKYGYNEGNRLLSDIAHKIYELSENVICCCRAFSDNFIIACRARKDSDIELIRSSIESTAQKLVRMFHEHYTDCNIIVNAGIYIMRHDREDIEIAIANANLARKNAKNSRLYSFTGFRCALYNASMSIKVKRSTEYKAAVDAALLNNDFIVQYQPRVFTDTCEIIGAEALVRWDMHKGYLLYPHEFLETLESDGSVVKMDFYVFDVVFRYVYHRMQEKRPIVPIAVNVAKNHFYGNELIPYIKVLLKLYPIDPSYVQFEIAEKIFTSELNNVNEVIAQLHELGFMVMMDDFGTGYSCLNTFMHYNIDGINLDKDFMKDNLEYGTKVIISGIIGMANKLGLEVLCEGVYKEEQREFLIRNECQYMQGYLYAAPMDEEEFNRLLES